MRAALAFGSALCLCSVLGTAGARAADLGGYEFGDVSITSRAAPIVIYDYQPGVMVRGYFRSPWRHRHYFPTSDKPPVLGRDEVIPGPDREMPEPAESYYRFWSTSAAIINFDTPQRPRTRRPVSQPDMIEPPQVDPARP
ncbi:MAG TPA: hypothetical protein VFB45_21370 [Pseudolabrys sp.]|nr:hypothetical protein [Pseudolabrys sp.]